MYQEDLVLNNPNPNPIYITCALQDDHYSK